ncbi:MAG: flagellar filament capping protein FliD [Treponema sp.]|nr:flagellar filament capping protein FliD [Treponema sp.]
MAGISIPGVTDQYNTSSTVEKLMQVERIPLTREQKQLDDYNAQRDAWRQVNTQLTSLRDSIKTLYSFENPFNNKITTSTDENAITATANRGADLQSFKIDVIQPATADRFLTNELPVEYTVPSGMYTYKVGEKQININWKGGSVKEFSDAINKRSNGIVKSMVIGASAGKKTLMIEALTTGKENKLIFEGAAKDFAISSGMVTPIKSNTESFGTKPSDLVSIKNNGKPEDNRIPVLSRTRTQINPEADSKNLIEVQPRGAFQVEIPSKIRNNTGFHITFSITPEKTEDITEEINQKNLRPILPDAGFATFEGIDIFNQSSETLLSNTNNDLPPLEEIINKNVLFAVMDDGSEIEIPTKDIFEPAKDIDSTNQENPYTKTFDLSMEEYKGLRYIAIKNENTGYNFFISSFNAYDANEKTGYTPNHPVSEAADAIIKYEGITIERPSNTIDDIVPEITLNIFDKTDKTATISVKADKDASKEALIEFVGKYNQAVAKINILSQNKNEIIEELDYLTDEEKSKSREQLGMFQTDFSLTSIKSNMQSIISTGYRFSEDAQITMLNQIGIDTNASGYSGSYSQSRLRGYLEIDEKKLDEALENNLNEIKNIFGYDSDGDLIIDSGIAYKLDKQITAYTQTGGILAMKTSSLDSKIKSSESKISRLEQQMDDKEAQLRQKYSAMEGSLNSLESQQNTISNFTKQQNNSR